MLFGLQDQRYFGQGMLLAVMLGRRVRGSLWRKGLTADRMLSFWTLKHGNSNEVLLSKVFIFQRSCCLLAAVTIARNAIRAMAEHAGCFT